MTLRGKSHVIIIIINKQGQMISRMRVLREAPRNYQLHVEIVKK